MSVERGNCIKSEGVSMLNKCFTGKVIVVSFCFLLALLLGDAVYAVDGLSLTGYVKSVDAANLTVTLDVKSESCRGIRTFKAPSAARDDLNTLPIGTKLQFSIDSGDCKRDKTYTIVLED